MYPSAVPFRSCPVHATASVSVAFVRLGTINCDARSETAVPLAVFEKPTFSTPPFPFSRGLDYPRIPIHKGLSQLRRVVATHYTDRAHPETRNSSVHPDSSGRFEAQHTHAPRRS